MGLVWHGKEVCQVERELQLGRITVAADAGPLQMKK